MYKICIRKVIYWLVFVFYNIVRRMSFHTASFFGGIAGGFCYYVLRSARRIACENLKSAFPGRSESVIKKIARRAFQNQGRNLFEVLCFDSLTRSLVDELITFEGKKSLDAAFKRGKGVLMLSGHFGNWELLGAALSLRAYPINVVARKIYIEQINDLLVSLRNASGMRVIMRSDAGSPRQILRALKHNECIGILIDQDAHVPGVWVDFFHKKAYTPSGLAALALKSNAAVVSAFIVRDKNRHRIEIKGPVDLLRTGNRAQDIQENTQMLTRIIEDYVRQYPEQWVWMHERWKH